MEVILPLSCVCFRWFVGNLSVQIDPLAAQCARSLFLVGILSCLGGCCGCYDHCSQPQHHSVKHNKEPHGIEYLITLQRSLAILTRLPLKHIEPGLHHRVLLCLKGKQPIIFFTVSKVTRRDTTFQIDAFSQWRNRFYNCIAPLM